jgi:hypothetical protein
VPILVENQDLPAYRESCREIITRFKGATNALVADKMAKDCLILPSTEEDLQPVAAMAEAAVKGTESQAPYPFFQCCKALAEYRQEHFEGAIKWSQAAARAPFPYSQAEAFAILAMAQYQMKQIDNAKVSLAKCAQVVETRLPKLQAGDLGQDWRDWIIAHTLLTEAQNLLGTPPAGLDSSHSKNK